MIDEAEEMQRHSELVERENVLRSLGVVESVYRLLHGTPGTTGSIRPRLGPGAGAGAGPPAAAVPAAPDVSLPEHYEIEEPLRAKPAAAAAASLPAGNTVGRVRTSLLCP